jgi:deferrochelatase/peroxidase EfeB
MSVGEGRLRGRRAFLAKAAGVAAVTTTAAAIGPRAAAALPVKENHEESFWGPHQAGIATPLQKYVYFSAFDLTTAKREEVAALLQAWTVAAARMVSGQMSDDSPPPADSGETMGLPPARLTLTFGFGAGLFVKDGQDRYGLATRRPAALVDLPRFPGDQLVAEHTDGDLAIQACADDPQVAFHAARQLARIAGGVAQLRWVQTGFASSAAPRETTRNLMGFKDGTNNPSINDPAAMREFVWVGEEGPGWMRGGSYLVARRIRIALEHWDRMKLAFQEQTVGRQKISGAPLGKKREFDPIDLDANDADGNPVIPENSHIRLAAASTNGGAQILRRPYSYNDGVNFTAERWPPWHQGMEYDAGLFFMAYQRDPRTGFIKLYEKMSRFDMMNQFVTHVGGGLFACPGGTVRGEYVGRRLIE